MSQDQVSLATMAIAGGPIENLASISVGWMVSLVPSLFGTSFLQV